MKPIMTDLKKAAVTAAVNTVCHSFLTDGRIQFLDDCTHAMAGQTVDLPSFPHGKADAADI